MESPIKLDLSESVNKAIENLAGPSTKTVGEIIDDLIFLCLGGIGHAADKKKLVYAQKLMLFQEGLQQKVGAIPKEKLVEPDTQKVMGALDDAKFCVEHDDLREMLENLIASSLSSDTASSVHPSFSGIIRRFSVLDAKIIALFASTNAYPVAEYHVYIGNGFQKNQTNVFLPDIEGVSFEEKAASLQNLASVGLIHISYDTHFTKDDVYKPFYETSIYKKLSDTKKLLDALIAAQAANTPSSTSDTDHYSPTESNKNQQSIPVREIFEALGPKPDLGGFPFSMIEIKKVDFSKGRVELTDFGHKFLVSCGYNPKSPRFF